MSGYELERLVTGELAPYRVGIDTPRDSPPGHAILHASAPPVVLPPDPPPTLLLPAGPEDKRRARTEAEELVRAAAATGEVAELSGLPEDARVLDAALLVELLTTEATGEQGLPIMHARGLRVQGGRAPITGSLDLTHQTARVPLDLTGCILEQSPQLDNATLPALTLTGCELPGLQAERLIVTHGLSLSLSRIAGCVCLTGAQIGGPFKCSGATVSAPQGIALSAEGATFAAGVFLQALDPPAGGPPVRCEITGGVRLVNAHIGASLECDGARLTNLSGDALDAQDATVDGSVFLRPFVPKSGGPAVPCEVRGGVWMSAVTVRENLECFGALLHGEHYALNLRRAEVGGVLGLGAARPPNVKPVMASTIDGQVVLRGAHIKGHLLGDGAQVRYWGGDQVPEEDRGAILAEQAQIDGDVRLRAFYRTDASGEQRLVPCLVTGGVLLRGAHIGGSLRCDGAMLCGDGRGTPGLSAGRAEIAKALYLRALEDRPGQATPTVPCIVMDPRLNGTRIGGRLDLTGARLTGAVRLLGCRADELADDLTRDPETRRLTGCWSQATEVALNGFAYDRFGGERTDTAWELRRDWLRQGWLRSDRSKVRGSFVPAPWDQL